MYDKSFKLIKTDFDPGIENPVEKYVPENDNLKSLLNACYWQMIYKGYLDDEIDAVIKNLSENKEISDIMANSRFPLALEILSTYVLQDNPAGSTPKAITDWFIEILNTIINPVANSTSESHPLLSIMALVDSDFSPTNFNDALSDIEQEAKARRESGKGLFEQRVEDISNYINWCVGTDFHGLKPEYLEAITNGLYPASLGHRLVVPQEKQPEPEPAPEKTAEVSTTEPKLEEPAPEIPAEPSATEPKVEEPAPEKTAEASTTEPKIEEPAPEIPTGPSATEPKVEEPATTTTGNVNFSKQIKSNSAASLNQSSASSAISSTGKTMPTKLNIPEEDSDPFEEFNETTKPGTEPIGAEEADDEKHASAGNLFTDKVKAKRPAQRVLSELANLCVSREQMEEALNEIKDSIAADDMNAQYLVEYTPGITPSILVDILQNKTTNGTIRPTKQPSSGTAIPHTGLTGGSTFQTGSDTPLGPIEIPRGFAQDNSSVIWSDPVITSMGFPFINFKSPEILAILKEKDPKKVKAAYKKVKKLMNKAGLSQPIKVLKDFKAAKGVQCALNRITIDAGEVLANNGGLLQASVHPRYSKDPSITIGDVALERDFVVELYRVLSPVKGAKAYIQQMGVTEDEYVNIIARDRRPPFYIFVPKDNMRFVKAPAGFIASLFTSNKKPTLVEAKMGSHFGGFIMPFRTSKLLFTEI